MEARELMIGNIVSVNGLMRSINLSDLTTIEELKLNTYTGIPLTEEWLLKFGFGIAPFDTSSKGDVCYSVVNHKSDVEDFIIVLRDNQFFLGYYGEWGVFPMFSDITCVHQIQNLHFALTREELTIKEPAV